MRIISIVIASILFIGCGSSKKCPAYSNKNSNHHEIHSGI